MSHPTKRTYYTAVANPHTTPWGPTHRMGNPTPRTYIRLCHMPSRLHSLSEHGKLRSGAPSRSKTGPLLRLLQADVPKRWFSHFYSLGAATSALVVVDVLFYGGSLFTASIQVRRG